MRKKPIDIKYSSTHTWVRLESNGAEAIIGITDYLLRNWDNIISINLPKPDGEIEQDSPVGEIESEDDSEMIISPLSGTVIEINQDVVSNPALLLEDQYEDGWLIRIRVDDPSEFSSLMTRRKYESLIESEEEEKGLYGEEEEEVE